MWRCTICTFSQSTTSESTCPKCGSDLRFDADEIPYAHPVDDDSAIDFDNTTPPTHLRSENMALKIWVSAITIGAGLITMIEQLVAGNYLAMFWASVACGWGSWYLYNWINRIDPYHG